ncbi:glutamine-hydrolyzing GMP synthase [bacterium]|nr:glutamine-hydrolyzing GMP synthase [bacterium]
MSHEAQSIVVLDYGSQYTQLIARRIRELEVFSVILPFDASEDEIRAENPVGIILSGGPSSVYEEGAPELNKAALKLGVPVLGICYGMHLLGRELGAPIDQTSLREYGLAKVHCETDSPLFAGLEAGQSVWMSHGDSMHDLPIGIRSIAHSEGSPVCGFENHEQNIYALQFHPEVHHSEHGKSMLRNFVLNVCRAEQLWTREHFIDLAVEAIRKQVGKGRVLCAVSGGVDSTVVAALLDRALGEQVECVFVNNGLLRKGEPAEVEALFRDYFKVRFHHVDASGRFIDNLEGVRDPEQKRKIIGETFIRVFEKTARDLGELDFLAQGTLYPDVIESLSVKGPSATIKSHHNVGGLPEDMKFELVEPLRELFKDEVREVGKALGLPEHFVQRHPFPGPGLGVRILGEVTAERVRVLQEADSIFIAELHSSGWYEKSWQALTVLLPVQSVGVMGDQRTYEDVVALRAVNSTDGMTADWTRLPADLLERVSNRIIGTVRGINRVVYDVSSKPPATIEWE